MEEKRVERREVRGKKSNIEIRDCRAKEKGRATQQIKGQTKESERVTREYQDSCSRFRQQGEAEYLN